MPSRASLRLWRLSKRKARRAVIGLSGPTVSRLRAGQYRLEPGSKPFELAQHPLRLFRSRDSLLGHDAGLARSWLTTPNLDLGELPIDLLSIVRELLRIAYVDVSALASEVSPSRPGHPRPRGQHLISTGHLAASSADQVLLEALAAHAKEQLPTRGNRHREGTTPNGRYQRREPRNSGRFPRSARHRDVRSVIQAIQESSTRLSITSAHGVHSGNLVTVRQAVVDTVDGYRTLLPLAQKPHADPLLPDRQHKLC